MLQVVLHEPCRVEGEPHDSVRSHVSRLLHRARTLMCARLSHLHLDRAHPVPHMRVAATHRYAEAHGLLGFLQVADATWAVRLVQHGISTCVALSKRAAAAADAPKDADAHMQLELPKHYYNVSRTGGMLHQTPSQSMLQHTSNMDVLKPAALRAPNRQHRPSFLHVTACPPLAAAKLRIDRYCRQPARTVAIRGESRFVVRLN